MVTVCRGACTLKYKSVPMSGHSSHGRPKCTQCGIRYNEVLGVWCPCCSGRLSYRIKGKKSNMGKPRM